MRRLLLLLALLMALSVITIGVRPSPSRAPVYPIVPQPAVGAQPGATVTATLNATSDPRTIAAHKGDHVLLQVDSPGLDSVEVVGLDLLQAVARDTPAQFDILADSPGDYPIVMEDSGRTVGTLHITPAEG